MFYAEPSNRVRLWSTAGGVPRSKLLFERGMERKRKYGTADGFSRNARIKYHRESFR
jgi:hypothetical protein